MKFPHEISERRKAVRDTVVVYPEKTMRVTGETKNASVGRGSICYGCQKDGACFTQMHAADEGRTVEHCTRWRAWGSTQM